MGIASLIQEFGNVLQRNRAIIRAIQWMVICFYIVLLIIPSFMRLPDRQAHILDNMVLFAQFVFWGVWWPFVILSMLVMGRLWCGVFCPEGALTEYTSLKLGRNRSIPRWLKWRGWPTVAFILTTLYGQLISVYDYAIAALLILGGSTLAAIVVGFLFGSGTRVWCRYLCPVSGVFNLLSRLSPVCFKTDQQVWSEYRGKPQGNPQCPPMINIHQLHGVSSCHMCGRCSGYRNAVSLQFRSPTEEVVIYGVRKDNRWEIRLLLFGMIGVAIGAFTWTVCPWFVTYKQSIAGFLVDHNIFWPLDATAPWWLLTNYPANNDSFNWVDGFCVATYIVGCGVAFGLFLTLILQVIAWLNLKQEMKNHLAQAFLPLAAAGLFLGLTATTVKLLLYNGISFSWTNDLRAFILVGTFIWSCYLAYKIICSYDLAKIKAICSLVLFIVASLPIAAAWWFMFWGW